jgi:DNA-binding CsgD family transcriptional regulator
MATKAAGTQGKSGGAKGASMGSPADKRAMNASAEVAGAARADAADSPASLPSPAAMAVLFLAFVCFFATLPMYSPNIVALNSAGVPEVTGWFAQGTLGFSIASALLAVVGLHLGRGDSGNRAWTLLLGPVAFGAYFLGGAGYVALVALGTDVAAGWVDALGLVCAALAGLSFVPVCVRWASRFQGASLTMLVALGGLGIAAAALVNMLVAALEAPASFILYVCLLAVGTFAPLAVGSPQASLRGAESTTRSVDLRSFASVMGTPLVGIGVSSFVIGIMPTTVFDGAVDTQTVGAIAAGLITAAALLLMRLTGAPTSAFVQRALIPVAAVAAVGACAVPGISQDAQVSVCYTLFSLVGAMALAMSCGISNAREFPRSFVFASLVGTYCLTGVLGLAAGSLLTDLMTYQAQVVVVLATVYGLLAVAVACARTLRPSDAAADALVDAGEAGAAQTSGATGKKAPADEPSLERRAELLAQRHGLTQREAEIVRILARGHGCTFVAETLLISKSTVYTHVRNIYRKLGISNHDQLIQALDRQR